MLGFAPIATLPLDTLPLGAPVTGTASFTESGLALLATGTVVNPVVIPPVTPPVTTLAGGGINWRQAEYLRSLEPKPKTTKTTKKTALRKTAVTAKARFYIPRLQFLATGEVRSLIFRATGTVINPITGTARFTMGKVRLKAEGEVVSITDDDLVEFSQLIEELIDA